MIFQSLFAVIFIAIIQSITAIPASSRSNGKGKKNTGESSTVLTVEFKDLPVDIERDGSMSIKWCFSRY